MSSIENVLITGGLGFIGSSLSEYFIAQGAHVTIVDSLVSNVIDPGYFSSIYPSVALHPVSVSEFFGKYRNAHSWDLVVHAASLVGPAGILPYRGCIAPDIVTSTAKIMEACIKDNVPLLYFSSAEVYGRSGLLSECNDIRVPSRCNARVEYALGKLSSESMIFNSRAKGLSAVVIRPFNVAGPRQSSAGGFVIPTFVQQALAGRPLTVFGSGEQKRAFTAIDDLAEFVFAHVPQALTESRVVYNVGNPDNVTTVLALAERVIELLRSDSEIVFTNGTRVYGPHYFEAESFEKLPDISAAKALGWAPQKSLDQIILDTASYYRDHVDVRCNNARIVAI